MRPAVTRIGNASLIEVACGIAAGGIDLSYEDYRIGGGDLSGIKDYVREMLAPDDPDEPPLSGEQFITFVARLVLAGMSAQYEVDAHRLAQT
jgi:hypothetical protein